MNAKQIQYAVAKSYNYRQNNIVPNVSWGIGIHECDLLIILRSKWAIEVEIKISKSDIKADFKKTHGHTDERIRELYYAIPKELYRDCKDIIPEKAGIITVNDCLSIEYKRIAEPNQNARKLSDEEISNILRLGNMRTWSMRKKILENTGIIEKPKRKTKSDEKINDAKIELNNLWYFLKRNRFDNPELISEQMESIERTLKRL